MSYNKDHRMENIRILPADAFERDEGYADWMIYFQHSDIQSTVIAMRDKDMEKLEAVLKMWRTARTEGAVEEMANRLAHVLDMGDPVEHGVWECVNCGLTVTTALDGTPVGEAVETSCRGD